MLVAIMRLILMLFLMAPVCILAQTSRAYTGSAMCKTCHPAIYNRWSKTLMANVVRDPKTHPDAIIPDLSKPNPLVKFTKEDIAFVYGSKWKQRYLTRKGDDYYHTCGSPKLWPTQSCFGFRENSPFSCWQSFCICFGLFDYWDLGIRPWLSRTSPCSCSWTHTRGSVNGLG